MNRRKRTLLIFGLALLFLATVTLSGMLCHDAARKTDFSVKTCVPADCICSVQTGWGGICWPAL